MALDEQLDESEVSESVLDNHRKELYSNLFFILQTEPKYIAHLSRLITLAEIDSLLQTVMFTIYGNQYDSREEYLLLSMFQNVLASQFDSTTDFGSLLRANTPVSRMMTTYTRRGPGQAYLKHVLSDRINKIIEERDLDLEINPSKVYEKLIQDILQKTGTCDLPKSVTSEEAAANPHVQAIIQPRAEILMEITNAFLSTIIQSIDSVPYGIRWICKQIKYLTKRKYPTATTSDLCSLIGGFFFLRFLNPAIVTPQAYMLVDGQPSPLPKRALTLIAKLLQNVANKPSYAKEAYMKILAPFIDQQKPRIDQFLLELCEVSDFYEALEMEQYIALSKKDIQLNIMVNELFYTHELLKKHKDTVCPAGTDNRLRIILDELGEAPAQLPRSENKTLMLLLFSRWESLITENPSASVADSNLTQGDVLYMDTKALIVQILRLSISFAGMSKMDLDVIADLAAQSKDPVLATKGIKCRDMLDQLRRIGVINKSDGYRLMVEELEQELMNLGNLRQTINKEMQSLELVWKTISDHNQYLRSQLESYKAYLQNVRVQSGGLKKDHKKALGPFKFSHASLEKDGTILDSNVPDNRKGNIYFSFASPQPGTFVISLHYKGREKAILEMDLKLDDLLEKQQMGVQVLDLEYVHFSVPKIIALLNRTFLKK